MSELRVEARVEYQPDIESHEYIVSLVDENDQVIDTWSSRHETYNSVQTLPYRVARDTIREIEDDVADGNADYWFDVGDAHE